MSAPTPAFNQVNLIVADMDASLAFYRALGFEPTGGEDDPGAGGARHAEIEVPGGLTLELDTIASVALWTREPPAPGPGTVVLGFGLPTRQAVDDGVARLVAAGHAVRQPPYDAFWGSRYAVVDDPDGRPVGLMSPREPERQAWPPPPLP